jgi:hypothetical protein
MRAHTLATQRRAQGVHVCVCAYVLHARHTCVCVCVRVCVRTRACMGAYTLATQLTHSPHNSHTRHTTHTLATQLTHSSHNSHTRHTTHTLATQLTHSPHTLQGTQVQARIAFNFKFSSANFSVQGLGFRVWVLVRRHHSRLRVLELEVFIRELFAID